MENRKNKNEQVTNVLLGKTKLTNTKVVTVWLFTIAAMAALVIAQDSPADERAVVLDKTAPASFDTSTPADEPNPDSAESLEETLTGQAIQSITFNKDMSVRDALRFLALKYQKNIVPTSKVDGPITITNLYDVTFEEALQAILGTNKYEIQGNFIKVYTAEEFQTDKTRMSHEVVTLHYIAAAEAEKLIGPLLSDYGKIATTTPAQTDTTAGKGGDTLAIRDRLVISDCPENIEKIKETIESIDIMPPQVLIEVTMLEAKLDETTQFGIDLNTINGVAVTKPGGTGGDGIMTDLFAGSILGATGLTVGLTMDHVNVFIRALESITDTTVLANPKILALNKQAGTLLIGEKIGYLTITSVSDGGTAIQEVKFLEVGTRLSFRPFICDDGYIRMEINPKQSEGDTTLKGDFVLPEETTTELSTNIMVKDGQTIVMGGLFREKTSLGRSQVPVLGDVPILGEVFKKTDDQSIRTELIVLITPHIINDPEQANGDERMQDVRRLAHQARKSITWLSRARRAEDRYAKAVEYYTEGNLDAAMSELDWTFESNRGFLDIERLRERIITECQPDNVDRIERIMLEIIEHEESEKWIRRKNHRLTGPAGADWPRPEQKKYLAEVRKNRGTILC
jgi:type IV pilus assembly protein PilQ